MLLVGLGAPSTPSRRECLAAIAAIVSTPSASFASSPLPLFGTKLNIRNIETVVASKSLGEFAKYPDPILRKVAMPVPPTAFGKVLDVYGQMLVEGMTSQAITALQYGVDARIIALKGISAPPPHTPIVFINPRIISRSAEEVMRPWREICLVFPEGLEIDLLREERVEVEYEDAYGTTLRRILRGEPARAFQHELDHLNGVLIVDHAALDELPENIRALEAPFHDARQRVAYARGTTTSTSADAAASKRDAAWSSTAGRVSSARE